MKLLTYFAMILIERLLSELVGAAMAMFLA
jgi:hypothetical protein